MIFKFLFKMAIISFFLLFSSVDLFTMIVASCTDHMLPYWYLTGDSQIVLNIQSEDHKAIFNDFMRIIKSSQKSTDCGYFDLRELGGDSGESKTTIIQNSPFGGTFVKESIPQSIFSSSHNNTVSFTYNNYTIGRNLYLNGTIKTKADATLGSTKWSSKGSEKAEFSGVLRLTGLYTAELEFNQLSIDYSFGLDKEAMCAGGPQIDPLRAIQGGSIVIKRHFPDGLKKWTITKTHHKELLQQLMAKK